MRRAVLAFLGDVAFAGGVARAAERRALRPISSSPGRSVFASDALSARTTPDGSLVIGDLFLRPGATGQSPGDGWGNFVAFSGRGTTQYVTRAPLTGMPLYWAHANGGLVCASDARLLVGLLPASGLDWEFIGHSLAYINLRAERTGLSGLRELLPGMRLEWSGGQADLAATWTPWDHVGVSSPAGASDLAVELERRIVDAVGAWSAPRRDILLELSGGLDSSIVAAALRANDTPFSAITFATPGADGDERYYARKVAAHCRVDLLEIEHDDRAIDLTAEPVILQARPGAYSVLGGIDHMFEAAIGSRDVALFGGIGGDNVFEFDGTVAPVLDAFDRFGYRWKTFEVLRDIARSSGSTIWEALRLARRARRAGPRVAWRCEADYLNRAALPDHPLAHPWDEGARTASQAKRNHVASIRRILDFLDRPGRWQGRDVVAPLLSQPVVELCLSIPSWTWFTGGRDRAIARAAFARHLPAEIIWRRGKGRLETMCAAAYLRQRSELRELLLGGRLAAQNLLDCSAIEAYLAKELVEGDFDYFRLIEIADIERWVRAAEASGFDGASADHR